MKFVYKPYSKEVIDEKLRSAGGGRESLLKGDVQTFVPKVGVPNKIRILPQTWSEDKDLWFKEVWIHYDVGPDNATFLCLKRNFGKDCPVCEAYLEETDPMAKQKFLPKKRCVAYVIERAEEKPVPKVWFAPTSVVKQILLQATDEDTGEIIFVDHPYEGYDITIMTQKGPEGASIKYTYEGTAIARKPSPIHPDPKVVEQILGTIVENPIPKVLNVKDYDFIKKVLYGYAVNPLEHENGDVAKEEEEEIREEDETEDEEEFDREQYEEEAYELGYSLKQVRKMSDSELKKLIDSKKREEIPVAAPQVTELQEKINSLKQRWGKK